MSSTLHADRKNNPDRTTSNESGNASLHDLIEAGRLSRRAFLQRSLNIAATTFENSLFDGLVQLAYAAPTPVNGIGFNSVPPNLYLSPKNDTVTVPVGYTTRMLIA